MTIILCGFKNCGKTTLGKSLAKKTGASFIDTDQLIIEAYKKDKGLDLPISEVFLALGEDKFRTLERKIIKGIKANDNMVIATGGGAILDDVSVKVLKGHGKLVYLSIAKNELLSRLMNKVKTPAFMEGTDPKKAFHAYYEARKERYLSVADDVLDLKRKSPTKWVAELKKLMEKSDSSNGE